MPTSRRVTKRGSTARKTGTPQPTETPKVMLSGMELTPSTATPQPTESPEVTPEGMVLEVDRMVVDNTPEAVEPEPIKPEVEVAQVVNEEPLPEVEDPFSKPLPEAKIAQEVIEEPLPEVEAPEVAPAYYRVPDVTVKESDSNEVITFSSLSYGSATQYRQSWYPHLKKKMDEDPNPEEDATPMDYANPSLKQGITSALLYVADTVKVKNKKLKPSANVVVSSKDPITMLLVERDVEVTLPESGFTVTLKPATQLEFDALSKRLIGFDSSLAALSNITFGSIEEFMINEELIQFIGSKITSATIDVENPIDYIMFGDYPLLLIGLLKLKYDSLPISINCVGTVIAGSDGEPICDELLTGDLDIEDLVFGDLTVPASITEEQYLGGVSNETIREFEINGVPVILKFADVSLSLYKEIGEQISDMLDTHILELFGQELQGDFEEKKADLLSTSILKNAIFLSSVQVGDDVYEDLNEIVKTLLRLNASVEFINEFYLGYTDFVNNYKTHVGIPSYTCGKCGAENGDGVIKLINVARFFIVGVMVSS